jgi:hypothetical protein
VDIGCEGNCEEHKGDIRLVHVYEESIDRDWGNFSYCDNAIAKDREQGFQVTEIKA